MNKLYFILFTVLFVLAIPICAIAQPRHPVSPPGGYHPVVVEYCYNVLFPFPHKRCEVRRISNYTPAPPPPRRHTPIPPPPKGHPDSHHSHKSGPPGNHR